MSDLTERLREHAELRSWMTRGHVMNKWVPRDSTKRICNEAADRIDELEAALAIKDSHDHFDCTAERETQRIRIDELEAALREIRDAPVTGLRTVAIRAIARRALEQQEGTK